MIAIARRIAADTGGFTGGPISKFGEVGFQTLHVLKAAGMTRESHVLDVGCGALRLGFRLIRFLEPDRYCGLEPMAKYVKAGLKHGIGPELEALKRPRFDHNAEFDFSPFGVKFDFVVARSIFSHASPEMVARAMESFRDNSSDDGIMLASYKPINKAGQGLGTIDMFRKDGEWSWRRYGREYLKKLARQRGLYATNFGKPFNDQVWLRVSRKDLSEP